jgi:2-amino-4-hydroxy-6-hydroxymethyldihydropteridine diphosphokinase
MVVHDQELDVPRDDILTYAFVLKPLVEIAAEVIHPETGVKLGEIWDSFNGQSQEIWEVDFKPDSKGLSPSIEGMN